MIVKCLRDSFGNYLLINYVYPVVSYKQKGMKEEVQYQILDEGGSLSYIPEKYFAVIHDNKNNYIRQLDQMGEEEIIYKNLYNKNFYEAFYSENQQSINARTLLNEALVDVLTTECSKEELFSMLKTLDYKGENYEMILQAFFRDANESVVTQFANVMYDTILEYNEVLIKAVIEGVKKYRSTDIENFLTNLYINKTFKEKEIVDSLTYLLVENNFS